MPLTWRRARRTIVVPALAVAALGLGVLPTGTANADPNNNSAKKLEKAVTVDGVKRHLQVFDALARNGGPKGRTTRAAGTAGYDRSVHYVSGLLRVAGYDVTLNPVPFTYTETLVETLTKDGANLPFTALRYTESTSKDGLTAALAVVPVNDTAGTGCAAADYAGGDYKGKIALVKRGICTFEIKHQMAANAGAAAVLIYNNDTANPDALVNSRIDPPKGRIPIGATSYNAGSALAKQPGATITMNLQQLNEQRITHNILAETRKGNADNVVMLGAHLDSVWEGPGINDNGTGSAALLEIALQFRKVKPTNKVRFAWWGAEELGLIGSTHYVNTLPAAERAKVSLYLNFDMIGSPNYMFGIYDGDNSDNVGAPAGPAGSDKIEKSFEAFYTKRGLPFNGSDFSGRSDYGPFIAIGIPSGGLFTGAEGIKTPEQAAKYGGTAGVAYDKCYHLACDTIANVNRTALDVNSDAIANVLIKYAFDTSDIPPRSAASASARSAAAATPAGAGGIHDGRDHACEVVA